MIHLNIILPSTPGYPKWYLSIRFPHQNTVHTAPLPHACYMHLSTHSFRFYHPKIFGEDYRSLNSSLFSFLHSLLFSYLLGQIFSSTPYSQTTSAYVPLTLRPSFTRITKTGKIIVLCSLIFKIFDIQMGDKIYATNDSKHSMLSMCSYILLKIILIYCRYSQIFDLINQFKGTLEYIPTLQYVLTSSA